MKKISILGSTGSIGRQALDVVDRFSEEIQVVALAAAKNTGLLTEQAKKYRPSLVAISDESRYTELKNALAGLPCEVMAGSEAVTAAAAINDADMTLAAISGVAGLAPVVAAIEAGKDLALANKESLVAGGELVMRLVKERGIRLLPVDSEHSAIFQCLEQEKQAVESLLLTASGGPLRNFSQKEMASVTPQLAQKHPTWDMSPKINVDCATLMNKGLEVIEAHFLFATPYEKINVVIHPESIIHSLVQYADGALLAHLGPHDMRIPIQYALTYPARRGNTLERIDLAAIGSLHFEAPDFERFPCLRLAYEAGKAGGSYTVVLNAVNEELVWAFLRERVGFDKIGETIEKVLNIHCPMPCSELDEIMAVDRWARQKALEMIAG